MHLLRSRFGRVERVRWEVWATLSYPECCHRAFNFRGRAIFPGPRYEQANIRLSSAHQTAADGPENDSR